MSAPQQLWSTGDIARELEVSKRRVYNWAYRGSHYLPEPYATTQSGWSLWTADQAKQIMADYHAREAADKVRQDAKALDAELWERAIEGRLSAA